MPKSKPPRRKPPQRQQPPAGSAGTPNSTTPTSQWRFLSRLWKSLLAIATLSGIWAYFASPSVQTPSAILPDNPSSLAFEVTNDSVLPIFLLGYTCDLVHASFPNGTIADGFVSDPRIPHRFLWPRGRMTARCENAYSLRGRVINAEYQLSLRYYAPPWPLKQVKTFSFDALTDPKTHLIVHWLPK